MLQKTFPTASISFHVAKQVANIIKRAQVQLIESLLEKGIIKWKDASILSTESSSASSSSFQNIWLVPHEEDMDDSGSEEVGSQHPDNSEL